METLELTDTVAEMTTKGIEYFYDEKRFIMIHLLSNADEFYKNEFYQFFPQLITFAAGKKM